MLAAGTSHKVTEKGLQPAKKVLRAQKRQARGVLPKQAGKQAQKQLQASIEVNEEDAVDVEEL